MDSTITDIILTERQIAYAIADKELVVEAVHGDPFLLWGDTLPRGDSSVGKSLTALVPELAADEETLRAVAAGHVAHLRYPWVNRQVGPLESDVRYIALSVRRFPRSEGDDGLIYLVQDVTEQGRIQQELMQRHNELQLLKEELQRRNSELTTANAELQLMNEIRASFVSVTAHELRTPLTSIYGYLEMLLDGASGELAPEQREYMELMLTSTERLLSTVANLLDVIRIDSDRLELILQPMRVADLVNQALDRFRPQLEAKGQTVAVELDDNLPLVLCDQVRAEQVLGHLLSNAIKFTPPNGKVKITAHAERGGGFVQFAVQDEGQGLDADAQERLFERFYRSAHAQQAGAGGVGLGLYLTRSLVELHGGQIWCESAPGQGSTFYVTLPAVESMPVRAS